MGEMVEFAVNGETARGYRAIPDGGSGPGVVVLQEWWGLVPQIKRVCDYLAGEGYVALAPDLYHGDIAAHDEMDKANQLMVDLPADRAAHDMMGAVDYLLDDDDTTGDKIGVVGFCMGGMLALRIGALAGEKVAAVAPFYGAPLDDPTVDWSNLSARVDGHFAGNDDFFPPDKVRALGEQLRADGHDVTFEIYPDCGHAFANEDNPLGTWNEQAASTAWARTLNLFESTLHPDGHGHHRDEEAS